MGLFSRKQSPVPKSVLNDPLNKIAYIVHVTSSTIRKHGGNTVTDKLLLASLNGGACGFERLLRVDKRCAKVYGKGEIEKTARAVEVWASAVLFDFFLNSSDLETGRFETARKNCITYLSPLFRSDPAEREIELLAYEKACEHDFQDSLLFPTPSPFGVTILYLMTLRALGDKGVPSFHRLPIPWTTPDEVMRACPNLPKILDTSILTNVDHILWTDTCLMGCITDARLEFDLLKIDAET